MPDYKTMYFTLFNTLSDVIELLKKAQREGERVYIENDEATFTERDTHEKQN